MLWQTGMLAVAVPCRPVPPEMAAARQQLQQWHVAEIYPPTTAGGLNRCCTLHGLDAYFPLNQAACTHGRQQAHLAPAVP